ICTLRRFPTNTPLQALVTLNDPAYQEMAQALGRRIVREGGPTAESRVRYALRLALARPPSPEQIPPLLDLYGQEVARYRSDAAEAQGRRGGPEPLAPRRPMLPAKAKNIIYLHMSGAPPTLDMFDYKPELVKLNMKPCPDALMKGERFAFIKGVPKMLGTPYK